MTKYLKSSERTARILRLISLLQSGEGWSVAKLMLVLNISRRTLFRDFRCLEAAGVAVYYERSKGYQIKQERVFPMNNITAKEVLGLMMLGKIGLNYADHPMVDYGLTALSRTLNCTPIVIRDACQEFMSNVDIKQSGRLSSPELNKYFFELMRLIEDERTCTLILSSSHSGCQKNLDFLPQKLSLDDNGWKVSGIDLDTQSTIDVRLSSLISIDTYGNS